MKKLTLVVMVAAMMLVSACGGSDTESLVVYSGRTENLVAPLFEEFTASTGVSVEVRYGQSADLALLIQQEGDRSPADLFLSQSPGAIGLLAGDSLLAQISDTTLGLVDDDYRNSDGRWVGLSGRVRVLVYNSALVAESSLPTSVFDLVGAEYEGRLAVAPSNGSFQDFVTGMREIHGDEVTLDWLNGLEQNRTATYANNSSIVQAVGRGEVEMGLVNHYYNLRALAEDPGLESRNHYFDDVGSLVIISAVGVMESSTKRTEAETLIRYLLEPSAQRFFSNETFEYPLASGSQPNSALAALEEIQVATHDFNGLSGGLARTTDLIAESGLEAP
ncbi:MAG: extracellular solute-binding protein [Acidimicrobiia bacterium]|nr:extracellular solute-binding protein [Acidimicrobiia bacterium]MDX2465828.1 extracellular solute-binding protein [Acidimicrobiia bacterium]